MGNVLTIAKECGCRVVNAVQCNPTRRFVSFCPLHESARKMREALQAIVESEGVDSMSSLKYAWSHIEVMQAIARKVLL